MKPDIDKKFDSLRKAPTEFSREQMESIIKGFPSTPATPLDTTNWTTWFSLNNLLVVGFVATLGVGLWLWNKAPNQLEALIVNELQTPTTSETVGDSPVVIDTELEKSEAIISTANNERSPDQSLLVEKIDDKSNTPTKAIDHRKIEKQKVITSAQNSAAARIKAEAQATSSPEVKQTETVLKDKATSENKTNQPGTLVVQQPVKTDPKAVPDLTNGEMRRLKKSLFKNLLDDKLIINKWKAIEIDLPGNEIIVNGKVIDQSLFNKYSLLMEKVGWGPDRKIKFDDEYIKVGNFTATGFRGSGFGTFRSTPKIHIRDEGISSESLALKREREIKKEQRELDAFSQTLLDTSNGRRGRKSIFDVSLKQEKCKKLHKDLYELLLEDGLIETKADYVLMEISKNSIHINVLELNEVLYEKYSELFNSYKIKPGPRRQIRMSTHTIRVGDFSRGSFTGTSHILN